MKFSHIIPFVSLSTAFVLPPEQVLSELEIEDHRESSWYQNIVSEKDHFLSSTKEAAERYYDEAVEKSKDTWAWAADNSRNALDDAFEKASDTADTLSERLEDTASDIDCWIDSQLEDIDEFAERPPHHKPGHGGHGGHGRKPHKPETANKTVYQLIAGSKYTTKLAKLISEYDDIVEVLNSTKANYTVFAPTDRALSKIPEHAPKPSKEQLKRFLQYHVVSGLYPAGRVVFAHTAPTLLGSDHLSSEPEAQRIAFRKGFKGITVNFISRIVAVNIWAKNGVIHGIDTPLFPPIGAIQEIQLFPGAFSTLELGLGKTGLLEELNSTDHNGGTLFAPNNWAFERLGPKINAFLFSKYGQKYLKALLQYHVVPENTLYSDAYYKASSSEVDTETAPKLHVDLPTALKDRSLSVDIARWGPIIDIKINGFTSVAVQDVVADDGVIHVLRNVLIPPKKIAGTDEVEHWNGEELTEEDLIERLEPFVAKEDL